MRVFSSQSGFFDERERQDRLTVLGDPLVKLADTVDFESFRPLVTRLVAREAHGPGGRPRFDPILMFKILVLQHWYGLADQNVEFQINDRLSFQRFLGLSLHDRVPDATTVWVFRQRLGVEGCDRLFEAVVDALTAAGVAHREGVIVDATFVDAPRQRNTRDENEQITQGMTPVEWAGDTMARTCHKDVDARWAVKNNETHFGYKDHVKADAVSKVILAHEVTDGSVHDSRVFEALIDDRDDRVWADAGYVGVDIHTRIMQAHPHVELLVCEKGYRGHPLTSEQKQSNKMKSKIRCRVEHVFAHQTRSMGGLIVTGVGLAKAKITCTLRDLAFNLHRAVVLNTGNPPIQAVA